jgi:hypothetical protein
VTGRELDMLLRGQLGVTVEFTDGRLIGLDRRALASPQGWRAAMRRGFRDLDYTPPVYDQDDHDKVIRAIFRMLDAMERDRREAA